MGHNDGMDEFRFLPAQADALGVPTPSARRLTHTLDDGRTLSALRYGDAEPAVVFLHGAGLNAHTWDTTILALGLPALAIDLPGHGDSTWREDADYSGGTNAASVAPALAAWTTGPLVLVGQSLGGLTAAAVAAAHPELVRELVIVDVTPGIGPEGGSSRLRDFFSGPTDWASREELVDRALAFGLGGTREAATRGVFHNSRVREDGRVEWKHHFARIANRLAADPDAAAEAARQHAASTATLAAGGWDHLAAVRAPITLLRGERGYVTDADVDVFRERVPHAAIREVAAGHNVQEEIPVELAAIVRGIAGR